MFPRHSDEGVAFLKFGVIFFSLVSQEKKSRGERSQSWILVSSVCPVLDYGNSEELPTLPRKLAWEKNISKSSIPLQLFQTRLTAIFTAGCKISFGITKQIGLTVLHCMSCKNDSSPKFRGWILIQKPKGKKKCH